MSTTPHLYRLICWAGDRIVSVSAPMPRDTALGLFRDSVASGRFAPHHANRAAVISEQEYAKRFGVPLAA